MFWDRQYTVYILASRRNGTLYIGVTGNLHRRILEHRLKLVDSFSRRYGVTRLVYYETCNNVRAAIAREKQLKEWKRAWKIALIEKHNPYWNDLLVDGEILPLTQ
jgi:putative endonuclease